MLRDDENHDCEERADKTGHPRKLRQWQVSTAGGIHPSWWPDGQELYYLNPAGAMMAAPITLLMNWSPEGKK